MAGSSLRHIIGDTREEEREEEEGRPALDQSTDSLDPTTSGLRNARGGFVEDRRNRTRRSKPFVREGGEEESGEEVI